MRWIKASERLPEVGWNGFFKYTDDDGTFPCQGKFVGGEGLWTGFVSHRGNFDLRLNRFITWLDESPLPSNEDELVAALEQNYQTQIARFYNDDKTEEERKVRNSIIQEYQDLIKKFKRK